MADIEDVIRHCDTLLNVAGFADYCPNGLQVEAGRSVQTLVTGVTASQALIERAVEAGADLLMVHHGYFWKGEALPLTGMKARRIALLFQQGISMAAYHLPLDAHRELGNNVMLARRLRWRQAAPISPDSLVWQTELEQPLTACSLSQLISGALDREPLHLAGGAMTIRKVAWCTGAAQSYIHEAAEQGCDAFISGEVSENTTHAARELGIHYFAAGHHATERYGIQALGQHLAEKFNLSHQFIDISNPV